MPVDFAQLTALQVRQLPVTQTVFFFPVGPLEDHGPHLPLGLDLSEADQLCRMAAQRMEQERPGWVGIIMPAAPLGVSANTSALAITVRGYVLRDWLVDACRSMMRADFRHFVCLSGQLGPRQLTAIEEAGKSICWQGPISRLLRLLAPAGSARHLRPTFCSASSTLVRPSDTRQAPFWSDPLEHGAQRDTSIALALGWMDGKSFSTSAASTLNLTQKPRGGTRWSRAWKLLTHQRSGYWGPTSPVDSSAAHGEVFLRGCLDDLFPKLQAVWDGSNPNLLFRSWYSILPPNKSFFKAWVLGVLIFGVMIAWVLLSFQSFSLSG